MIRTVFRKVASFLGTESSLDALRNIFVILIPSSIIFYFVDGHIAIPFAVGALLAALTDLPGNKSDKLTTAAYCLPIFLMTALSMSLAIHFQSWTIILLLGFFGFIYTIIALLGIRVNVVGNLGLIVASFTIGLKPADPLLFSLSLCSGGLFFFIVCIIQVYLSPLRSLAFSVDSSIKAMAKLIKLKVSCYDEKVPLTLVYKELGALHIKLSDQLESIRSILLRDKKLHSESDLETKIWLSKLYQLIDLYELLMAIDNDYDQIREILKGGNTLKLICQSLCLLSKETKSLRIISKVRRNNPSRRLKLEELLLQLEMEEADASAAKWNLICSLSTQLRHVSDILQNIQVQQVYQDNTFVESKNYLDFLAPRSNIKTILTNMTFKSPIFSYAIRMSVLLIIGGLIGFLLPGFQYASWILLTIILVARPSYTITQKRNFQRIIGSIIGIAISLFVLLLIKNVMVLVIIAVSCLYLFLLFNKPNYLVCCIFITITILIGQHIHEGSVQDILGSRFAFTLLGSIFAILGCLAIPINHYRNVDHSAKSLIQHFRTYSIKIQESYKTQNLNYYDLRLLRKFTQDSLAQTYDTLDQLAKEPLKGKDLKADIMHFQTLAYRINALLVGLSVNLTKLGISFDKELLKEKISFIDSLISELECLSSQLANKKIKKDLAVKLKSSY